ncbi:hypothetical protein AB0M20_30430 [Actinoplanes sp. NPDC051633]|uniref:hypothetical protein n=1 Tax=Actinoplanes sp. NPDC051633 TaxID=3155670 RepID=UPI003416426E
MSASVKMIFGFLGALLVIAGVTATVWGMFAGKDVNSVGLAAIFLVGIALVYGGIFGLLPDEIGIGDKAKIKMQAAADAMKTVKQAASSEAVNIAQSPDLLKNIVDAKDASEASAAVEGALKELVDRIPATADVLKTVT